MAKKKPKNNLPTVIGIPVDPADPVGRMILKAMAFLQPALGVKTKAGVLRRIILDRYEEEQAKKKATKKQ